MKHFWQGQWLDDASFDEKLKLLPEVIASTLQEPLDSDRFVELCDRFSCELRLDRALRQRLSEEMRAAGEVHDLEEGASVCDEIAEFLSTRNLRAKLHRELGEERPFETRRIRYDRAVFERWAPLGFLVHVTPSNVSSVAILSTIEGLIAGNLNFVKLSGQSSRLTQIFFEEFLRRDATDRVKNYVLISRFPSSRKDWMSAVLAQADGLAAWGGEEAVSSLKAALPSTARLIAWGHRISLIFVSASQISHDAALKDVAREICLLDQQACSSPQCLYLETEDPAVLKGFAARLADHLGEISPKIPRKLPDQAEAAEISIVTAKHRVSEALGHGSAIQDPKGEWRILVDHRPSLAPSPLFRTIWVKPLRRQDIVGQLRPFRGYLQTVGLVADVGDAPALCQSFLAAGALRFRPVGKMLESYPGEPHDGEYALSRYAKKISFEGDERYDGLSSFTQIAPPRPKDRSTPLMNKSDFQSQDVAEELTHLIFKSGGSSGDPKTSVFTYADYHRQMRCAADGLYAAGLDPLRDRCVNLFFAGGMYGGFLSFFSVLEHLGAKQLPMAAHFEWDFVIDAIIRHRANVLLGMPSYLLQLFAHGGDRLARAGIVKKVFYGGEHLTQAQRRYLQGEFGVEIIRSAAYGSVDAGPLGYQCPHCEGSVHHLHHDIQDLEIVRMHEDAPVEGDEVGRLVFSSKARSGQQLLRYEIGDLGRWVSAPCECGRNDRRFELLGRQGDIFRAAGSFLNYRKWQKVLAEVLGYSGEFQIELAKPELTDRLVLRIEENCGFSAEQLARILAEEDRDFAELLAEKTLIFSVSFVPGSALVRTPGSGKLVAVVDRRAP